MIFVSDLDIGEPQNKTVVKVKPIHFIGLLMIFFLAHAIKSYVIFTCSFVLTEFEFTEDFII